ncbi:MAG TPA: thiamine-phosphate kinase [Terriglobia bacterium]|nr:thiamine-phosphate kinase [Terriglobia bacterium]
MLTRESGRFSAARGFRSEDEFVEWVRRCAQPRAGGLWVGIGDDTAVVLLRPGRRLLLTTDLSIEGVHFDSELHPAESVGHRALARSLSDIAAMGGTPRFALVSLALSSRVSRRWVERFYAGLFKLARRFGVEVVGGDTSRHIGKTLADVMVAGEASNGNILLRSGARAGDRLYVAGDLGAAALGLKRLRLKHRRNSPAIQAAVRAHLYPEPQCELGRYLAAKKLASAAMDLSDGLSSDLRRLCVASGVGARICADRIPCVQSLPGETMRRTSALGLALHGGEDYSLLFTVPPSKLSRLPAVFRGVHLFEIGQVTASRAILLVSADGAEQPLAPGGYDHFRPHRQVWD